MGVPYPTKGNLINAIVDYSWASIDNVGIVVFFLGFVGFAYALYRFKSSAEFCWPMLLIASLKRQQLLRLASSSSMLSTRTPSRSMSTTASGPSRGRRGWFRRSPTSRRPCRSGRPSDNCQTIGI